MFWVKWQMLQPQAMVYRLHLLCMDSTTLPHLTYSSSQFPSLGLFPHNTSLTHSNLYSIYLLTDYHLFLAAPSPGCLCYSILPPLMGAPCLLTLPDFLTHVFNVSSHTPDSFLFVLSIALFFQSRCFLFVVCFDFSVSLLLECIVITQAMAAV